MNILIVGASKGLGKAFVEGLCAGGNLIIGVSRNKPTDLQLPEDAKLNWIQADMAKPVEAANQVSAQLPTDLDVVIYNLGIWEADAFSQDYDFLQSSDQEITRLINTNVTSALILLKRLLPTLLKSARPQIVLTGSTSGLPQSGAPEVAFGASKFALRGIADSLREGFRDQHLAVTCLQIGDLNTSDGITEPVDLACERGGGHLIPLHDVVDLTRTLLSLSTCSFVKEITMPAILDEQF